MVRAVAWLAFGPKSWSEGSWVKNGDRWTITRIGRRGDLTVRHNRSQLTIRMPIDYVRTSTGLGYATTIHSAQGVSADTMHGLLTGQESRQQLYTMLTRGRHANHLYLQVVGDGDPHTLIRPDTISPRTPTENLQQILARDEAPVSASTLLRELHNPAGRACSPSRPTPVSIHSCTCRQRPPDENSTPPGTWPPCWTGASQNQHPLTQDRFPGFAGFRKRSMIIPCGANIWRSGPN